MESTTTGVATGTSPEVLQHYLTAGIEVQVLDGDNHKDLIGRRARLYAVLAIQKPQACVHFKHNEALDYSYETEEESSNIWSWRFKTERLLPCLRPFAALTQQLPDGTVPAAIQMLREIGYTDAEYIKQQKTGTLAIYSELNEQVTRIYQDWGIGPNSLTLRWAEVCRKYHFALPINGKPLLEGQDFIAL